jgi:hypothetical protein
MIFYGIAILIMISLVCTLIMIELCKIASSQPEPPAPPQDVWNPLTSTYEESK